MKTPNGKCTNWKWPKPKKTWKKQTKNREFWLAPPSKESRNSVFVCFFLFFVLFCVSKVFNKCGLLQGNWHESQAKLSKCLWERSKTSVKTSQHIILNHGKTALPGAAVLKNTSSTAPPDTLQSIVIRIISQLYPLLYHHYILSISTLRRWYIPNMAVCQNLVPLVNIKIAGKWMFIP